MTVKINSPEEAEALDTLRTYHTPKLDEFRALLPEIETSNLIQHMINPTAIMTQLTGYDPTRNPGEAFFNLALQQPSQEKLQEIQVTIGAALLAICEELDERIPPRKATIVTTPAKSG